jgi:hypothetical protein
MLTTKLLKSPFECEFRAVLNKAEKEIVFSSPYINDAGASVFIESIRNPNNKRIRILTNLSVSNDYQWYTFRRG